MSYIEDKTREAIQSLTEEQVNEVCENFERAGYAFEPVSDKTMERIGLESLCIHGWETFCSRIYKMITGEAIPPCDLMGRGFRSQWHGKIVSEAIRSIYNKKQDLVSV